MSRKVINITHSATKYDILSQTPKNYKPDNYFLKELQDKVNAEWAYRPNRVDVEFENQWGEQTWSPLEVVVQSVLSEKGTAISNDTRNLVFKNILEDRFNIGNRFRFSDDYNLSAADEAKNVWLVSNLNKTNMTSSVVVERCNGTLGSLWDNGDGTVSYHYEPVIQGRELTSVNFFYNETLISQQSQLLVIAQHNKYTGAYQINQRFIVGYDKVYRIKAINKFYNNSTNIPKTEDGKKVFADDVGLVRIYMEITESAAQDDFERRIAFNQEWHNLAPQEEEGGYMIAFESPEVIPTFLGADAVIFTPVLKQNGEVIDDITFALDAQIDGVEDVSQYVEITEENGSYTVQKIRNYRKDVLKLKWSTTAPNNENVELEYLFALAR